MTASPQRTGSHHVAECVVLAPNRHETAVSTTNGRIPN